MQVLEYWKFYQYFHMLLWEFPLGMDVQYVL